MIVSTLVGASDGVPAIGPGGPPVEGGRAAASFGTAHVGSAPTGEGPSAIAFDPGTDTIYVGTGWNADGPNRGANVITVIDGRRCDARVGMGLCGAVANGQGRDLAVVTRARSRASHGLRGQLDVGSFLDRS